MESRFEEVIATRDRLRELNKLPSHRVSNKAIDHIDDICRRFIAERKDRGLFRFCSSSSQQV